MVLPSGPNAGGRTRTCIPRTEGVVVAPDPLSANLEAPSVLRRSGKSKARPRANEDGPNSTGEVEHNSRRAIVVL